MSTVAKAKGVNKLLDGKARAQTAETTPPGEMLANYSLIGNPSNNEVSTAENSRAVLIPLDLIDDNTYQPRSRSNPGLQAKSIERLAASIEDKAVGLANPITVRKKENGRYELVAGSRRCSAFKFLKRDVIPAFVRQMSDLEASKNAFIDNDQREEMLDYEIAVHFKHTADQFPELTTPPALAKHFQVDEKEVYRLVKFWLLPPEVHSLLDRKPDLISKNHAEKFELLCRRGPEAVTLVIEALSRVFKDDTFRPANAEEWVKKQLPKEKEENVSPRSKARRRPVVNLYCTGMEEPSATLVRTQRKVTVSLAEEIDPAKFEAWLQSAMTGALGELRNSPEPAKQDG